MTPDPIPLTESKTRNESFASPWNWEGGGDEKEK